MEDTAKKPWATYGIIVGAILLIASLLLIVKWQHDTLQSNQAALERSTIEMQQLRDNIVRAQAQYVSKEDLEKFAKNSQIDLTPIKEDLERLDAQIKGISVAVVATPGYTGSNLPSTSTNPKPNQNNSGNTTNGTSTSGNNTPNSDPYGYQSNAQILVLREPFADGTQVPFGSVEFHAWEPKPWNLSVIPRQYTLVTVLGQDEDGRHYAYNKFTIKTPSDGKSYSVKIDKAEFKEELPESKFRFSPRLYLGVDVGATVYPTPQAEVIPNLEVALFSYGKTKVNPSWTFLGLGVGYGTQAKALDVVLSPVNYNVGQHLPLVENLHIGPTISVDTTGGVSIMGGLRVGL